MKFNNKKKIILGSIITLILIISLGVTYAFFTFGKTSLNSQLVAGDIYMKYKETNSINIPDMMPRNTYVDGENGYFEFQITGKNTYTEKDIIYDVVLSYGDTPTDTNRTIRIKDELLKFRLVKVVNNEEQEIFTDRSYTSINNTRIHKETIPAETNSEITTTYRIYAWISEETKIGNTEDADYSLSDWNKVFASIKVNVTGDFQEKKVSEPLYDIVKTGAQSDATISNLYAKEGVGNFLRSTTASDPYPVYYYRGAVENNNVVFANKCWKIVRTTDTGGTKLIYNGEIGKIYEGLPISDYNITTNTGNFEYNSETTAWETVLTSNETYEINFTVPAGDNYIIDAYAQTSSSSGGAFTVKKGDNQLYNATNGGGVRIQYKDTIGTLTSSDVIKLTMQGMGASASAPISINIKVSKTTSAVKSIECDNTSTASQLPSTTSFQDTDKYKSPAYVGYNYGTVYEYDTQNWTSGALFGSSYTWDGTNYKLVDATVSTPNPTHHYSCNATTANATCQELRYVYYMNGSTKYYITLQNGKGVEEALKEMLSESSDTVPSNIKGVINTWYETYIEDDYDEYVEDTKWCMDRSVSTANLGGWNSNGGNLSEYMYFDVRKRMETASASTPPVLTCSNTNDIMTKKNGKLDYPVALLTYDEASLAGVQWNPSNSSSYLLSGSWYWLLSPSNFDGGAVVGRVHNTNLNYDTVVNTGGGVRPSLSLKHGTLLYDGDGTVANPYIVGTPLT